MREFFEASDGRLSMTRLLMFLAFWPSMVVVVWEHEAETLAWFLSAYAAAYGAGKFGDAMEGKHVLNSTTQIRGNVSIEPHGVNSDSVDISGAVDVESPKLARAGAGEKRARKNDRGDARS